MLFNLMISILLIIVGLCLGSFAGASVWRLRSRQLIEDKAAGDTVNKKELTRLSVLTDKSLAEDRSICLQCGYKLKWYDLIPLISWTLLRGKCRKCHQPIGYFEPIMELGVASFFVVSYIFWPFPIISTLEILRFILWLLSGVGLAILFAYDTKWYILPDKINYSVIFLGAVNTLIVLVMSNFNVEQMISIVGSVAILSGLYLVIYYLSKGKWIGFGDIKLGLGLGLLLADWRLAFIALFSANLVGTLLVLPAMLMGRLKRNSRVPFGPLLIVGFIIAGLAGNWLNSLLFYSI